MTSPCQVRVTCGPEYDREREYACRTVLEEFLGLRVAEIQPSERPEVRIEVIGDVAGRALVMPDGLFATRRDAWLQPSSLPARPLPVWRVREEALAARLVSPELPVLYGADPATGEILRETADGIVLDLDVLGSAFLMLSRYEEIVKSAERDAHERFPATASLAFQEGFLDRPVINEYSEVLKWVMSALWPGIGFRERRYSVRPTHDVDLPFREGVASPARLAIGCAADLLRARSVPLCLQRLKRWRAVRRGDLSADSYNTFDYLMSSSEERGLRSAFYFVAESGSGPTALGYSPDHPWIRSLLRQIHERGHEVGFHASYSAFGDGARIASELAELRRVAAEEGVDQQSWGGRQHYLRWVAPDTWQDWHDAGLGYDSTLSYADCAGFRCGVCYEYPVFNALTRERLALRERPLIAMEGSIFDPQYMALTPDRGAEHIALLASRCRLYDGEFVFLWHNNYLVQEWQRVQHARVLNECA